MKTKRLLHVSAELVKGKKENQAKEQRPAHGTSHVVHTMVSRIVVSLPDGGGKRGGGM